MRLCVDSRPDRRCLGVAVLFFLAAAGLTGCGQSEDDSKSSAAKSDAADAPAPHPFAKAMEGTDDRVPGADSGSDNVVASNSESREPSPSRTHHKSKAEKAPKTRVASPSRRTPGQPKRPTTTTPSPARGRERRGRAMVASIHLSTGTKLPVSLPNGTNMAFTAEYRFTNGQPQGNVQYIWVIEGRGGKRVRVPLKLQNGSGKLPQFFTRELRPGDEPFRSYIEARPLSSGRPKAGAAKRVSNVVPMS